MVYYAVIGDIKKSKSIEARSKVQEKLNNVLMNVNTIYRNQISANFLITLGDEFQGLLTNTSHVLSIIKYIQREMYPIKIRFGIGIGEIHTKINREAAIGADGPAFYAARSIITEIHNQEKKMKRQAADIQISFYNKSYFAVTEINTMLTLLKTIEDSWTEKQRYTIWDILIHQDNQIMCAKRMGTTQSTIARRLAEGKYLVYKNAMNIIEEAIQRLEDIK